MASLTKRTRIILAVSLLLPAIASLWRIAVADIISSSTFAAGSTLLLAGAAVALIAYKNGQASSSMGQLLHETDIALPSAGASAVAAHEKRSE